MQGQQKTRRTTRHESSDILNGARLRPGIAYDPPYTKGRARRALVQPAFIHHATHGCINAQM